MNRRRSFLLSLFAAACSLLLVLGVYELQIKQVELQKTIKVIVPKDFIKAGTMLTEVLLEEKPILSADYLVGMFTSIKQAAGKECLAPLGKGEPLLAWKLDKFHLLPRLGESTFQIPKEYILSVSNGIRAGDKVRIYVSDQAGESKRLFAGDITVASVKSSANVEVDDLKSSNLLSKTKGDMDKMYASRRDANGVIDQVNLNLSEGEWLTIDTACKSMKSKLVIAFTSASITDAGGVIKEGEIE